MKALTLTQPWATLIALGIKKIETRSWRTFYRGPLAIHAAKSLPAWQFRDVLEAHGIHGFMELPLGVVVATCELVSVRLITPFHVSRKMLGWQWTGPDGIEYEYELTDLEMALGEYSPGRYAWLLHNIVGMETWNLNLSASFSWNSWSWSASGSWR